MTDETFDVAVVGAGGGGTMAFLRAVLNGDRAVLFTGDADDKRRGRATWVGQVDNIPGMHDVRKPITSTAASTLKWIRGHAHLAPLADVQKSSVKSITRDGDVLALEHASRKSSGTVRARFVILATGIMDRQPHIKGSIEPVFPFANRGDLIYCVRCDGHHTIGKDTAVIGDGESAAWIAVLLKERYDNPRMTVVTNGAEPTYGDKVQALLDLYGITRETAPIAELVADDEGALASIALDNGTSVSAKKAIVALGIIPYNQLLTGLGGEVDDRGRAVVSDVYESTATGVFVVGDLVAGKKMQVYTAWDQAVDAADAINTRLRTAQRRKRLQAR